MLGGRPRTFEIKLTETERTALVEIAGSCSLPDDLARRTQVILLSADAEANRDFAVTVHLSGAMTGHWRRRYRNRGSRCARPPECRSARRVGRSMGGHADLYAHRGLVSCAGLRGQ